MIVPKLGTWNHAALTFFTYDRIYFYDSERGGLLTPTPFCRIRWRRTDPPWPIRERVRYALGMVDEADCVNEYDRAPPGDPGESG